MSGSIQNEAMYADSGGFGGRVIVDETDPEVCHKELPDLPLARQLAGELLPN